MTRIENWIRQELRSAVNFGIGRWSDSLDSGSDLGRPIYDVTDGQFSLTLGDQGLLYSSASCTVSFRYDSVESMEISSLRELMTAQKCLDNLLALDFRLYGQADEYKIVLPLRIYAQVCTVIYRIVDELAR